MKATISLLTKSDKEALALFFETPAYKALVRLIEVERLELAKDHVNQLDMLYVRFLSGQAEGLKKLIKTLEDNHEKMK
jgi:hypothetical protein